LTTVLSKDYFRKVSNEEQVPAAAGEAAGPAPAYRPRDLDGDPVALRALAHPLRLRLIEELTLRGPMTATAASRYVGESPSSCSFHLRTLAKYGFVEEAEGGTGRQRPWRVAQVGSRWSTTSETPAAERAAGETLAAVIRDRDYRLLQAYLERADELDDEWRRAAFNANYGAWLTPEELDAIGEGLTALWEPYVGRFGHPERIPDGARMVHLFAYGFPRADFLDDDPHGAADAAASTGSATDDSEEGDD
jgi:DNA-binding transcriptional ArsR family regulator